MTIGKKIAGGFAVALGFLTLLGALALWTTWDLLETSSMVNHTHEVLEDLESVLSLLKDGETGMRGYAIGENDTFLAPYRDAEKKLPKKQENLLKLTSDNKAQQARLEKLNVAIQTRMAHEAKILELASAADKAKGFAAAREKIKE